MSNIIKIDQIEMKKKKKKNQKTTNEQTNKQTRTKNNAHVQMIAFN